MVVVACVLAASTGCDVDSVTADAGVNPGDDGSAGSDAATTGGLTFDFRSKPKLPPFGAGDAGGSWDAKIETATIVLGDVRAIGDAAPGSGATTRDMFTLTWVTSDREELVFANAPPGIYSLLRAQIVSWDVTGEVDIEGAENVPFHIADAPSMSLSLSVPILVTLASNDDQTVRIDVNLDDIVEDIDWDEIDLDDGTLDVTSMAPDINDIRNKLTDAFGVHE